MVVIGRKQLLVNEIGVVELGVVELGEENQCYINCLVILVGFRNKFLQIIKS